MKVHKVVHMIAKTVTFATNNAVFAPLHSKMCTRMKTQREASKMEETIDRNIFEMAYPDPLKNPCELKLDIKAASRLQYMCETPKDKTNAIPSRDVKL